MDQHFPAIFIGDALGLDFLNSIATPVDTPVDWIADGKGLLDWLEQARLVPADALKDIRARALPSELAAVADQARSLREWFRGFVQKHKGRPLDGKALDELDALNRLLDRDEAFTRIVARREKKPVPFELQHMRRWQSPEALLLPIGEAIARFVCTEDFSNVRACEGPTCTLFFADHTRGGARRWCSMAICGNRAKQAAHRHRLKRAK
jgi:predicted RNA-binding Zn ribbon-like protein